jgi:hypothetical protein
MTLAMAHGSVMLGCIFRLATGVDMAHRSLRLTAAKFVLGVANTSELIDSAHEALNDSVYSYSLGELATFRDPTWGNCSKLFVNALDELQTPLPPPSAAVMALLEHHLVRLVEDAATPTEILHHLYATRRELSDRHPATVPPAALEPLWPFIELYYVLEEHLSYHSYRDEMGIPHPEGERLESVYAEALNLAADWCRERWGPQFLPTWRTDTVLALAQQVRASRDFGALQILADALQEAGCDCEDMLDHCRANAPHVHRCWVVDLVLGKE